MLLGRVIGTVWATRKDEKLEGLKLLVVRQLDLDYKPTPAFVIAVDTVQAGVGEIVLVCQGSSARQTKVTEKRPVDAVVMAVVDTLAVKDVAELEKSYQKRAEKVLAELDAQPEL
jgi:microcompartment protein CcmK/EutM